MCVSCSESVCHLWHGYHISETSGLHQNIPFCQRDVYILNTLYNGVYNRFKYHTWPEPSYTE